MKKIIILSLLLFTPFLAAAESRTITVYGEATKKVNPDMAEFQVNIQAEAREQAEAKTKHDKSLKDFYALAKEFNLPEQDMNTSYSSISPRYDWSGGKQVLVSYITQSNVGIKIKKMEKVAEFQDALAKKGFESVSGPFYQLDERSREKDSVLADALKNAKEKAMNLAAELGEKIGKPLSINEGVQNNRLPMPFPMMAMAKGGMAESTDAAVAPPAGIIEVHANITATFELQ